MRPATDNPARRLLLVAALLSCATPGAAVEIRGGQQVVVAPDEVVADDLYATGETVTVDGVVAGDLVAAGRQITVRGSVEGDLIAAGQAVVVEGRVGDDARIAGMALKLGPQALIADDLFGGGLSLEAAPGSEIGGTVFFSGHQAIVAGEVGEKLSASLARLELLGGVGGDVELQMEGARADEPPFVQYLPSPVPLPPVPAGLTVGEDVRIGGRLTYSAPDEGRIDPRAVIVGGTVHEQPAAASEPETGGGKLAFRAVRRFATLLLFGLAVIWLAPRWLDRRADDLGARPLPSLGWGVLAAPVVLVVAVAVLAGTGFLVVLTALLRLAPLAFLVLVLGMLAEAALGAGFWLAAGFVAPVIVSLFAGRAVLSRIGSRTSGGRLAPLVTGLVLFALLRWIPIAGAVVGLLVAIAGLGTLWLWVVGRRRAPVAAQRA